MRHSRTISFLALFAVLLSLVAPPAAAFWECEGRTCANTIWSCCCAAPAGAQDRNCESSASKTGAAAVAGAASCNSSCNCVLVVRAVDPGPGTGSVTLQTIHFQPAVLPRAVALSYPLPSQVVARAVEDRGPPPSSGPLGSPSLRAPPAA